MDSVAFTGAGKWNGKSGYTFDLRATDQGEPGRNRDTFWLIVKDSRGTIVASVSGKLDSGNISRPVSRDEGRTGFIGLGYAPRLSSTVLTVFSMIVTSSTIDMCLM